MRYHQTHPPIMRAAPADAAKAARATWGAVELLCSLEPKAVAAVAQAQKVKR
jgi:hypothetical protein